MRKNKRIWTAAISLLSASMLLLEPIFAEKSQSIFAQLNLQPSTNFAKDVSAVDKDREPVNVISFSVKYEQVDDRALRLEKYLDGRKSPMAKIAPDFIEIADKYNLDWKLLPAIAGVESTFGRYTPGNYNPYGWNNAKTGFANWQQATETVARGLRTLYVREGEITPAKIGRKYAPPTPSWASRVGRFMAEIEKTVLE
jgi:membrane-bound lytic murein transglycosylase B